MTHKDPEGYISDSGSGSGSGSGSEFDDNDHDFGDWKSDDSNPPAPTQALFPSNHDGSSPSFKSPQEALKDAKSKGCDLVKLVYRLQLDTLQIIRLINHTRRYKATVDQVNNLTGQEEWLYSDEELKPVEGFEDDGLLQLDFDLLASEVPSSDAVPSSSATSLTPEQERIRDLEQQLSTARQAFTELKQMHATSLGLSSNDFRESSATPLTMQQRGKLASSNITKRPSSRTEDDILYFDSYAANSIHQTMITDSARTLSYARFLLSPANSHLIRGKIVMDVGCGTGILSLFAARAGAKQVIAIDASDIVDRARQNVEDNGFGHVVKVFRGRLEDLGPELEQFKNKVDILVSEWMGYFLLYENMLPSVLIARDLYLNPTTGILAPNQMTMHLAAFTSKELLHTKLGFWDNVHGFRMSSMTKGLLDEAFVDTLDTSDVVTDSYIFATLDLQHLPPKQPEPTAAFQLTVQHDAEQIHGFISWFDTFFHASPVVPQDAPPCPPFNLTEKDIPGMDLSHNAVVPEFAQPNSNPTTKGEMVAFSTGPASKETHWQQTLFILKDPIQNVKKGDTIKGQIIVSQDQKHERELDVELHYLHVSSDTTSLTSPQSETATGKKKVEAMLVQLFKVR